MKQNQAVSQQPCANLLQKIVLQRYLIKKRCQSNVNIDEYDTCKHFKLLSSQEENQLTSRQLLFVQRQLQQGQKDSFPSFTEDETETYASWQFCVVGRFVS